MPVSDFSHLDRFAAALPERPASFADRGLVVPFTAPMLAGARLRRRGDTPPELLLPALGGRGVYILGWDAVLASCAPTLHDRALWRGLAKLARPTPASVRAAARAAAATGLAGRAARHAAEARLAEVAIAEAALRAEFAARLGPEAAQLEQLVPVLAETGAGATPGTLLATRFAAIERMAAEIADWAPGVAEPDGKRAAVLLAGAAGLILAAAQAAFAALRPALAGLPARLTEALALAERPDLLLDGWDAIAALWAAAPTAGRPAALHDALVQLPAPPLEVDGWPGPAADWDTVLRGRRLVAPRPSWASGNRLALVSRAERLREIAA